MQHLTFGLIDPSEMHIVQQMIQGTSFCSISFNQHAEPVFVARSQAGIIGFIAGHKSWGSESHVLVIDGAYISGQYNDKEHLDELKLAFAHYAEQALKVTHYKIGFDDPQKICVMDLISPKAEIPAVIDEPMAEMEMPMPELKYAYT